MSTEERDQAIGRLARELAAAKRQRASVGNEIELAGERLYTLTRSLSDLRSDQGNRAARKALHDCIEAGGLEKLGALMGDLNALTVKVAKLEITAREVGIL
jgi:hypothetical protein